MSLYQGTVQQTLLGRYRWDFHEGGLLLVLLGISNRPDNIAVTAFLTFLIGRFSKRARLA